MDITIDSDNVLVDFPRQRGDDGEASHRAALSELAAVASAQASRRDEVRAEIDIERVVEDAAQERARSAWRGVGVAALLAAIAALIGTMVMVFPRHPHAVSGQSSIPAASIATARALGDAARSRLAAAGEAATPATCLSAYAADAAASPLILPPASKQSVLRDRYVTACLRA